MNSVSIITINAIVAGQCCDWATGWSIKEPRFSAWEEQMISVLSEAQDRLWDQLSHSSNWQPGPVSCFFMKWSLIRDRVNFTLLLLLLTISTITTCPRRSRRKGLWKSIGWKPVTDEIRVKRIQWGSLLFTHCSSSCVSLRHIHSWA